MGKKGRKSSYKNALNRVLLATAVMTFNPSCRTDKVDT